jgi:T-complex protein 1 subunit eta
MHPQVIIRGLRTSLGLALDKMKDLSQGLVSNNAEEKRNMLIKCAETALNSKLLSGYKRHFSELVVSAVETLDTTLLDKELIGIKEVTGGSVTDSFLVKGVAFKKTFSYAGF